MVRVATKKLLKRFQFVVMRNAFPVNAHELQAIKTGPRIFANSLPKSGTNLLRNLLHHTPYVIPRWTYQIDHSCPDILSQLRKTRNGQVVTAHLPWSYELSKTLNEIGMRAFFIIRDPRDVAVSGAFYIGQKDKNHRLHKYFRKLDSDEQRIKAIITGIGAELLPDNVRSKSLGEHLNDILPWLEENDCLLLRFEDLIGNRGGGDDYKQLETVHAITQHLGLNLTKEQVGIVAKNTFSVGARTFRKGQIGDWRNYLNEEHKTLIKKEMGEILIRVGYENDLDW